jgi:hypothetical protein
MAHAAALPLSPAQRGEVAKAFAVRAQEGSAAKQEDRRVRQGVQEWAKSEGFEASGKATTSS